MKLTVALSDEKIRWGIDVQKLIEKEVFIPGDSIIATGMVAYSGPFTSEYRKQLETSWI